MIPSLQFTSDPWDYPIERNISESMTSFQSWLLYYSLNYLSDLRLKHKLKRDTESVCG